MISRQTHQDTVARLLRDFPVVALLGARQVGKTTLAQQVLADRRSGGTSFDLEDPADLARLDEPSLAPNGLRGLVVLDQIQRRPELFPVIRINNSVPVPEFHSSEAKGLHLYALQRRCGAGVMR